MDGFVARPNGGPGNALGDEGLRVHRWMYDVESWRERQSLQGGQTNVDDEVVKESFARVGSFVLGRWMFDELQIRLAPVLLDKGVRLFDGIDPEHVELEDTRVIDSPGVTHLGYRIVKEN